MNEKPLILCVEDDALFGSLVKDSAPDFSVDVAMNGFYWAKHVTEKNKKYVAIVLDGQFPLTELWEMEQETVVQELIAIWKELDIERQSYRRKSSVAWIVFIHFLVRKGIDITQLFWILNSVTHSQDLRHELEQFWVHPDKIKSIYDKGDLRSFQRAFADLMAKIGA